MTAIAILPYSAYFRGAPQAADMNRRRALSILGTAASISIAGCTRFRSVTSPETDHRIVHPTAVDSVPGEYEIEMAVDLVEPRITSDHTARIQIATTNEGPRRAISVADGSCGLFNRSKGGSDSPRGLWLHRSGSTQHIERDGDRWVADKPQSEPRVFPDYGCLAGEYDTGDTVTNEYEVWDDYRVAGYMDPGTYRWHEQVRISNVESGESGDKEGGAGDEELGEFYWGFEIELQTP